MLRSSAIRLTAIDEPSAVYARARERERTLSDGCQSRAGPKVRHTRQHTVLQSARDIARV
jgi:hypothetical protein